MEETENDRVTDGRKKRIKLSHFFVDCLVSFLRNTSAIIYPTQSTADLDKAPGEGRGSISVSNQSYNTIIVISVGVAPNDGGLGINPE